MKFIPCATWIRRGVCMEVPDKISLTKDDMLKLFDEYKHDGSDESDDDDEEEEEDTAESNGTSAVEGAAGDDSSNDFPDMADINQYYSMNDYDEEDNHMEGLPALSTYPDNSMDPNLAMDEKDLSSDEEDYRIQPDDNLVAVGTVEGNTFSVEFYIYNNKEEDFFAHHSLWLQDMPICVEWVGYDPGESDTRKGNLVAVGSVNPVIELWDVDIENSMEPAYRLGTKVKTKKKTAKIGHKMLGHTDAVLDLSWNIPVGKTLASASADKTVRVWNLNNGKTVTTIKQFSDKVQAVEWRPNHNDDLLTGSFDQSVRLFDCRIPKAAARTWNCSGEIERVLWNRFDPACCFASTSDGKVCCFDVRCSEPKWTFDVHESAAVTGISLSCSCPGLLVAGCEDEHVYLFDVLGDKPVLVDVVKPKLGKLCVVSTSPDSPFTVFCGGTNSADNVRVLNVLKRKKVKHVFEARHLKASQDIDPAVEDRPGHSANKQPLDKSDRTSRITAPGGKPKTQFRRKKRRLGSRQRQMSVTGDDLTAHSENKRSVDINAGTPGLLLLGKPEMHVHFKE